MEKLPKKVGAGGRGRFSTTRWTIVFEARDPSSPEANRALETLCRTYWYPLYAFVRRTGRSPADSEDLTQGFFARLLEKEYLNSVTREKGRFRSFLLVAFKRYIAKETRRERAQKRGGGIAPLSLDTEWGEKRFVAECADNLTPEDLFERNWVLSLLDNTLARLRAEYEGRDASDQFDQLKAFVTVAPKMVAIAEVAAATGMSEGHVRVAAHRLRKRYRTLLREEIAHTLVHGEDIEDELRHLRTVLSRGAP